MTTIALPRIPALAAGPHGTAWLDAAGEIDLPPAAEAALRWAKAPPLLCHRVWTAERLGCRPHDAFDILELYAFVRPAAFAVPTPTGIAQALDLPPPGEDAAERLATLWDGVRVLLGELSRLRDSARARALGIAWPMAKGGWPWGTAVLAALGAEGEAPPGIRGLMVWERLKEWEGSAPPPPPGCEPVSETEIRARLADLLGPDAEQRPSQADYAAGLAPAFAPRAQAGVPNAVLAEAGTGVGKTLAYIAPAGLWAEKNGGAVWISTFTRNLQRQLDGELSRLYPDPADKARNVVVRRGRENLLCLLNLEDALARAVREPRIMTAIGLVCRWVAATRDGAMVGGDFPGWLVHLLGRGPTLGLADRRGECLFSACAHYGRCFVEKSVRAARHARIVVANHALVMTQAALGGLDDAFVPTRYVFDEGHHVFDAADSAFSATLSGREAAELRHWILGGEDGARRGGKSRSRGLRRRCEDLAAGHAEAEEALEALIRAARALPAQGWEGRLGAGAPQGPVETFLAAVEAQVLARVEDPNSPYSLECAPLPLAEKAAESLPALDRALDSVLGPARGLAAILRRRLAEEVDTLEATLRLRMEAVARTLDHRALTQVAAWRAMLKDLSGAAPPEYADWFAIERIEGRNLDVGYARHWIDPTIPLAACLAETAHGVAVTSATLRDAGDDPEAGWDAAALTGGTLHFPAPAVRLAVPSPFDYGRQTRVLIVHDVARDDPDALAAAVAGLFKAAGGGALGLFTAIQRLKEVHARIRAPLAEAGLDLLSQHLDGLDTSTLVDIFRAEENACLLGTDAVRDGVDVPGRSLRLIVFDRVPWPRPGILYRARRDAFGGAAYTDRLTRMKLRQAFGRLIRSTGDRGVFVLLAPLPSRLLSAFPDGVAPERTGIRDAIAAVSAFFAADGPGFIES